MAGTELYGVYELSLPPGARIDDHKAIMTKAIAAQFERAFGRDLTPDELAKVNNPVIEYHDETGSYRAHAVLMA